ncbi:MAG: hypothetical protein GY796_22600 [Chloroflexi bacterium]|nr:hypothetical protein [Chloroflexota bacterium]
MLIKRLILIIISLAIGLAVTIGIVYAIGTNPEQFGVWYTSFTALALGCAVGVWLDKFMGTEMLPK